jgi:hypothetical protein
MVWEEVYENLRRHGLVQSESEFSKDWLGRSECYLRNLRFNGLEPSISSIAVCASKLQYYGERLAATKHTNLAAEFVLLAERCHRHVNGCKEEAI